VPITDKCLTDVIENMHGFRYDAVLFLSGGKDSCYTLHRIRKTYPRLRILSVFVENGYSSTWALANAQHVATLTETDFFVINNQQATFKEALRDALIHPSSQGCYATIDYIDGSKIFELAQQLAESLNIKWCISGLSGSQLELIAGITDNFVIDDMICPLAVWQPTDDEILAYVRQYKLMYVKSLNAIVSNSQLVTAMLVLDVRQLGYSSFAPEFAKQARIGKLNISYWRNIFEFSEFLARHGLLDHELERILKTLEKA
jgi:hypothetical protein